MSRLCKLLEPWSTVFSVFCTSFQPGKIEEVENDMKILYNTEKELDILGHDGGAERVPSYKWMERYAFARTGNRSLYK